MPIDTQTNTSTVTQYLHTLRNTLVVSGDRPESLPQEQNRALLRLEQALWNHEKRTPEDMTAIKKAFDAAQPAFAEYIIFPIWPDGINTLAPVETDEELGMPPLPKTLQFPAGLSDRAWRVGKLYENYSRELSPEGYDEFHESCFISMLSAVAKHRIKIPFRTPDYTQLMIILTANTTGVKKTTTAKVTRTVLKATNLGWMINHIEPTPQSMIQEMAGHLSPDYENLNPTRQEKERQELAFSGQRGQIIGEFGKFVKAMMNEKGINAGFQEILLKMDDCEPEYGKSTVYRGTDEIENPYLSLLGCMTLANIKVAAKSGGDFWTDGFWARFAFCCPPKGTRKRQTMDFGEIPVPYELWKPLAEWHIRLGIPCVEIVPKYKTNAKGDRVPDEGKYEVEKGELPIVNIELGQGVRDAYVLYRETLDDLAAKMQIEDLSGNYGRLAGKAMRVAALLASLENDNRIELWHWAKAQEICERWRRSLHRMYTQINDHQESKGRKTEEAILDVLKRKADEGTTEMTGGQIKRSSNFLNSKGMSQKDTNEALYQMQRARTVDYNPTKKMYSLPSTRKVTETPGQGVPGSLDADLDISFDEAM